MNEIINENEVIQEDISIIPNTEVESKKIVTIENTEAESKKIKGHSILKLSPKEYIGGKEISELIYDFSTLKGKDIQRMKQEMAANGIIATMVETDTDFHTYLFAYASNIAVEDVYNMNINNYLEAIGLARNFIIL